MSSKPYSLAVEEIKEEEMFNDVETNFEPQLKILINKRWNKDSDPATDSTPVSISGRVTISF